MDMELSEQNVADILRIIRQLGPEIPSMIWGSPGIGKTEATKQAFGRDHEIVLVLAGCSEPTDISGVPHPHVNEAGVNVATDILVPLWAYNASAFAPPEKQGPQVIFFDDIVTGHEQTQAACFKVFGEKRVGNLPLRDNVYIIGAGNRIEDKSAAFEMPLALANRMKHYYAKSDVDAWVNWATDIGGIHPLIVAYIRTQGNALNRFDEIIKTSTSEKAFPTPRTWELLSKSMWKIDPAGGVQGDWL
jgi:MoxR-like ATPase